MTASDVSANVPPTDGVDVVVCGSGVAGMATAHALGQAGLTVALLEKKCRQPQIPKGEVLQPGSLNILAGWEVLHMLDAQRPVRLDRLVARTADGAELLAMDFGLLGTERPWMLAHEHSTILDCLADTLGPSVRWCRGVLVSDILRDADGRVIGVRATGSGRTYDVRARLVVAADGISSRLGKLAGMSANPIAYDHRLLSFELPGTPAASHEVSVYVTHRGMVMIYPLPDERIRVYVQVAADELRKPDPQRLQSWCDDLIRTVPALAPLAPEFRSSLGTRRFLPVWRYRAPSLVRPGITLIGEAAHSTHPLAAQGMNTAIGDAHALATHLAAVNFTDRGELDGALLAYQNERLPRIRDVHSMSHNAARMMTSTSISGRLLGRRLLRGTARNPRLRYLITYNMAGIGMHPLSTLDRLIQLGAIPDRRARSFTTPP
jgi:2-polyprenyl-6-methoxyphenol hydroxylase-like FAD-dependent oxidoreductase